MGISSFGLIFGVGISLALAIFIGYPSRALDYEGTIIPMLTNYSGNDNLSRKNNDSTQSVLNGTIIVITGATSGIGLSITRFVSKFGATVIALGRSEEKLMSLRKEFPSIITIQVDQSSLQSVANAADTIRTSVEKIHILVNNAGMHAGYSEQHNLDYHAMESKTPGLDNVFVVNYLSHFLLTEKLADMLQPNSNGVSPKIVQISSTYHWAVDGTALMPIDSNNDGKKVPLASVPGSWRGLKMFRGQQSYANSKLAQIYHTRALKEYHNILSNATIISICPLWVGTEITRTNRLATFVIGKFGYSVHEWGISSALHAMFDTYDPQVDYIGNSNLFPYSYIPTALMKYTVSRDVVSMMLTGLILVLQRFAAETLPQTTSPESYNATIIRDLYYWSLKTVSEYSSSNVNRLEHQVQ